MRSADTDGNTDLSPRDFVDRHRPALERDEVRHNVLIAILNQLAANETTDMRRWTLGEPGACAAQTPPYPIALGELTRAQCHALADQTCELDYPGLVGPDLTTAWFVERATALGIAFGEPVPQKIHALRAAPRYPGAPGSARAVG
ncbi:MAG: hypothetical protein QOG38_2375, partial [Hyphomicrobiales bacterium]|nr:hypothetical protein [Hyphomicrobiales bacterium]